MIIDWPLLLRDGAILSVAASAWVMASLRYNPRLFLRHYPKEIREAAQPLTVAERGTSKLIGLPFLLMLAGVPIWSVLTFANEHPRAIFLDSAFHGFGVAMVFNLVDLIILDLIWLGAMRPRWAMIPGTESIMFRFNVSDHLRGFVVGTVLAVILGSIAAAIAGAGGQP